MCVSSRTIRLERTIEKAWCVTKMAYSRSSEPLDFFGLLMEMRELKLEGEGANLHIVVEEGGWAKCYLRTGGSNIFLGAEEIHTLAAQLVANLRDEGREPAGAIDGHSVRWVASLSEAHYRLYFYIEGEDRVLIWQDADAQPVAVVKLSEQLYGKWCEQLERVVSDRNEI